MKCGGKVGKWPRLLEVFWIIGTVTGILGISILSLFFYGSYSRLGSFL